MEVFIDSREHHRIKTAKQYYTEHDCKVQVKELPIGDYLFDDQVVFEYKTQTDFINSVRDNRVFRQTIRQQEHYPYHFVIITGTYKDLTHLLYSKYNGRYGHFTIKQYTGAIARLNTYTTVIQVPTEKQAYRMMITQAQKCLTNTMGTVQKSKKQVIHEPMAYKILAYCIPDISNTRARKITETLKLETMNDLTTLTLTDLTSVPGIGEKTAKKILQTI